MKLHVSSPTHRHFNLAPLAPEQYTEDRVPGSEIHYAEGDFGRVVIQHIPAGPIDILYNFYDIQDHCELDFKAEGASLRLVVALQGRGHFIVEGAGETSLEQGQFNIIYTPGIETRAVLEPGAELLCFCMYVPASILKDFSLHFPIDVFIKAVAHNRPTIFFGYPGWVTGEMMREVGNVLGQHYDLNLRPFMADIKAKLLLHLMFMQKFYLGKAPIMDPMLEHVRRARHMIESCIGELLTAELVAERIGIRAYDLKKYFKLMYNMPVGYFIVRARLYNARMLLQETDLPIKAIAQIAGYEHEQNFIHAFKKFFDYTPYYVRQQRY